MIFWKIDRLFKTSLLWVYRYPRHVLFLYLLIFSISIYSLRFLEINISTKVLLNPESASYKNLETFEGHFGEEMGLVVLLKGDILAKSNACSFHKFIESELLSNNFITKVKSPFKVREAKVLENKISYPTVLNSPCDAAGHRISLAPLAKTPWASYWPTGAEDNKSQDLLYEVRFEPTLKKRSGQLVFDPKILESFILKTENFVRSLPGVKVYFTGQLGMVYYPYEGIKRNQSLNFFVLVLIFLLSKLFWGSFLIGVSFVATLAMMGILLYAIMAGFNVPIDLLNSGLFLLVAISTLEDFAFVSSEKIKGKRSMKQILTRLITPAFYTSLTTILGFGSLYFSDIHIIKRFGLLAATGAFIEWTTTFWLFPALLQIFPKIEKSYAETKLSRWIESIKVWNLPRMLQKPLLLFFIGGAWVLFNPRISESPYDIFFESHPFRQGLSWIQSTRNWETSFDLFFIDAENVDFNQKVLEEVKKDPLVANLVDYYNITENLTKEIKDPLSKDVVIRDYRSSSDFKNFISESGAMRSIIFLKNGRIENAEMLLTKIDKLCQSGKYCFASGNTVSYVDFALSVPRALISSFGPSLIMVSGVLIFLALSLGSNQTIPILVSSFWGPFALLSIMGLFNVPINFLTSIFASIIVGLTGDNAIQYLFASHRRKSLDEGVGTKAGGSIQIFLLIVSCALLFQLSYFKFSSDLGMIFIVGMLCSLIGDLWLLKLLIKPRN